MVAAIVLFAKIEVIEKFIRICGEDDVAGILRKALNTFAFLRPPAVRRNARLIWAEGFEEHSATKKGHRHRHG